MSTALKRALRVVLALPAIGFVVTGLRFAVAPAGAAKGSDTSSTDPSGPTSRPRGGDQPSVLSRATR